MLYTWMTWQFLLKFFCASKWKLETAGHVGRNDFRRDSFADDNTGFYNVSLRLGKRGNIFFQENAKLWDLFSIFPPLLSKPFILTIKIIYCCAFLGRLKKLECMCKSGRSHLQLVNPRWSFPFLDNVESVTPSIFVLFPTLFLL